MLSRQFQIYFIFKAIYYTHFRDKGNDYKAITKDIKKANILLNARFLIDALRDLFPTIKVFLPMWFIHRC